VKRQISIPVIPLVDLRPAKDEDTNVLDDEIKALPPWNNEDDEDIDIRDVKL
jgi:hypothetical protein